MLDVFGVLCLQVLFVMHLGHNILTWDLSDHMDIIRVLSLVMWLYSMEIIILFS